ncbi:MAG: hypothetical protein ACRD0U_17335 [Acidimicrobiales bacterium]
MPFEERHLRPLAPVTIDGRLIKRYHVTIDGAEIDADIQAAANAFVPRLLPEADETPPAAFQVLHQGQNGVWLNLYSWVWDNVLHCRCADATSSDPTCFTEMSRSWIGCVWELPPLAHERSAWVRHMLAPDEPDLEGYLADMLAAGPVGGP